jgi:hypothetical protein
MVFFKNVQLIKRKINNMKTILVFVLAALWIWMLYEFWSAPTVRENEDGTDTVVEPRKKLRDLFKNL